MRFFWLVAHVSSWSKKLAKLNGEERATSGDHKTEPAPRRTRADKMECTYTDYTTRPLFGKEGTKRAIFCSTHAEDGMVNVHNKKVCTQLNCRLRASFGVRGTKTP